MMIRIRNHILLPWNQLKKQLTFSSDPEFEQAIKLRLSIGIGLVAYFCLPWAEGETFGEVIRTIPSIMALSYYSGALAIAAAIFINPSPSPVRRILGSLLDLGSLSVVMFLAGDKSVFLFVLYLWVILGNGFRFGTSYLYLSLVIGVVGFASSIIWGEYWQLPQHEPFGLSLLLLIIIIPLYSAFLIKKLHSAISAAKLANQAKSRFLANMSHELRTPLNGVIGIADLMGETELNSEQREFVKIMRNSANTLLGLIENVLDISKIEAGKIESVTREFDLHELIATVIRMQTPIAKGKQIELFYNLDPQIQFSVTGDQQHLRQVLINLIGNAIKFTHQGFVRLSLKALATNIENQQTVRFEVTDTGIGIPEDAIDNIFNDFTQANNASNISGTGLGTTISKELIELMDGRIGADSKLGEGTTFWFELPFKVNENKTMTLDEHAILVLSHQALYDSLDAMMQTWGVNADHAANSAQALALLIQKAEAGAPYSTLIVENESMLDIEPAKFARMIKSDPSLQSLSLILVNSDNRMISEDISNHYISVINTPTSKSPLFNALHAAHSSLTDDENVVRLADYYASQGFSRPLNILVSEDNKVNQQILQGVLQHAGHKTLLAETGEQALDLLTKHADTIDLVILDMNMPERSGLEVLQAFRYIDTSASIPVIMLTADATPEARQNCEQAGADAFLTKPLNSRALLEKISQLSSRFSSSSDKIEDTAPAHDHDKLIDDTAIEQLSMLGNDDFLRTLVNSFKYDGNKHINLIMDSCHDDYLTFRESLHALKGSATEMSAHKLASLCAQAEKIHTDEIGQSHVIDLSNEIAEIFNKTITHLEEKARTPLNDFLP